MALNMAEANRSGAEVMVACKAPNGLVLNLDHYVKAGQQNEIRREEGSRTVTLRGWSKPFNSPPATEGGYALTAIPADFWEQWYERNKESSLIKDRIILPPHKDAVAQARDHAAVPQQFAPAKVADVPGLAPVTKDD